MSLKADAVSEHFFALVPAAGSGSRAGGDLPKQYACVGGRPVLQRTLDALLAVPRLAGVLVVLAPPDVWFEQHVTALGDARCRAERVGAGTRAATVLRGLEVLPAMGATDQDWVLVHDAARCLLEPAWVDRLIDACRDDAVGGLLALPVADTLKQAQEGRATATVDRADKWAAQTPQMFRIGMLRQALAQAGPGVTDDASAIEALGHHPLLVRGDTRNLKITWPEDFALAEQWARAPGDPKGTV